MYKIEKDESLGTVVLWEYHGDGDDKICFHGNESECISYVMEETREIEDDTGFVSTVEYVKALRDRVSVMDSLMDSKAPRDIILKHLRGTGNLFFSDDTIKNISERFE